MARRASKGDNQEGKKGLSPLGPEMTPVNEPKPQRGELNRGPAGGTVFESGRVVVNVGGKELCDGLARDLGLDENSFAATYGANVALSLASIYPCPPSTKGAAAIRRNVKKKSDTYHLGGLFRQFPGLRVSSTQDGTLTRGKDSQGRECIFISLRTTLDRISAPGTKHNARKNSKNKPANGDDAR